MGSETDTLQLVPASATLDGFAERCRDGIALESLAPGTLIVIQTRHSRYEVAALDGCARAVLVRGAAWCPTFQTARLRGSTAGGCALRLGWIGVGLQLEIAIGRHTRVTSPVESISSGRTSE